MRIGLVCPYSLTVPGGVQGQVLGLARVLRAMGHEARVLAPCDGPPPELFVIPLGDSIPTAANGSVAPLAPDPACQLRTIRALADEAFDVLHLHEPLAPGPTMTALVMHPAPTVGTFHAAGDSTSYRLANRSLNWLAGRLDLRVRRLRRRPRAGRALLRRHLRHAVQRRRGGALPGRAIGRTHAGPRSCSAAGTSPARASTCCSTPWPSCPRTSAAGWPRTARRPPRCRSRFAGDPRIEWLGRLTDDEKIARLASADVFCAPSLRGESFGVVLIEAMAAGTPIVASDLPGYRRVALPEVHALLTPPGDTAALATALKRVLEDAELGRALAVQGAVRAEEFSMRSLAEHYVRRYQALLDEAAAEAAEGRAGARVPAWVRRIMAPS